MDKNKLYIKNMVCDRCIHVVRNILTKLEIKALDITLGEVSLQEELDLAQKATLEQALSELGFHIIDEKNTRLTEKVKNIIIKLTHQENELPKHNLSEVIKKEVHHDYNYISNIFSETQGTTIEKYFIAQKIEKVKELLTYDELSLSEIAYRMHYSSVAYLSNQFKKITGFTPSQFKLQKKNRRTPLDQV